MKRRKHRVVVEITLDEPGTAKDAVWVVDQMLDHALQYTPLVYRLRWQLSTTPIVKQFDRVLRAEQAKGPKCQCL